MTKVEFYTKWLETFAAGIPKRDLAKYVVSTGNLLWHIFSFELLDDEKFLAGDKAKEAFNKIDKRGAIYFDWFYDEKIDSADSELKTAKDLDKMIEVYVVASDFSWTYMKTHESSCGPYFMKI